MSFSHAGSDGELLRAVRAAERVGGQGQARAAVEAAQPALLRALIEAAKLAPRYNEELAALHAKECERGHRNRATVEVARALAARLLAVDGRGTPYEKR